MSEGRLVLVGTPIGNLGDLSPRAVATLDAADVVACEDTRRTGRLLQHAGIKARALMVVNDHTEHTRIPEVLDRLGRGETVAVVTDGGMPGISDPGERLVAAAVAAGYIIEVVPGPTAVISALVVSGLAANRFCFEGFLARKGSVRTEQLQNLVGERRTMVFYEAPHRLVRTLDDLAEVLGDDRRCALARELTKLHEEVWRGTLGQARASYADREPRGEFVIVVDGAPEPEGVGDEELALALAQVLGAGGSRRDAAAQVAERYGVSRRRVYELSTSLRHTLSND